MGACVRFLRKVLRGIKSDEGGNALMIGAITLPMVIGAAGLGLDTVQWTLTQRQLQRAADSAAIAGAYARLQNANVSTNANQSLARDGLTFTIAPVVENAPTAGAYTGDGSAVRVVLRRQQALPFSSFFMQSGPTIFADATAKAMSNGDFCVIALEGTATTGITMQGNATVNLGCGMATNSQASNAVIGGGSSLITASPLSAVGGITPSNNFAPGTELLPGSIAQADPYSGLPDPNPTGCSNQLRVGSNQTRNISNSSGTQCFRGIDIQGTAHFDPGIYFVDGSMSVGAQATVTGTGVTFILTSTTASTNPSSIGQVTINGGATMQISAPTSGTYAGILFYQDRRAPNSDGNRINGNSSSFFQGAFYFPSQGMDFNGTTGMRTECVQIAARRVTFIGNSTIINQCPPSSGAGAFSGLRVFLVE